MPGESRFPQPWLDVWQLSDSAGRIEHMIERGAVILDSSVDELARITESIIMLSTDRADASRIDLLRRLEELTSAVAATKARMATAFAGSQRRRQRAAGMREERIGQGIAEQVALARRESPAQTRHYVGWAEVMVEELPRTFAALQSGQTTERRAMIVARETIWLTRDQRSIVDAELADRLGGLGDREVEAEAKKLAYRLDPAGFVGRSRKAANDRRVTIRPAPDTMTRLTALVPAGQGVAAYAALHHAALAAHAAGDERTRGQVMADTLGERVTGQAAADAVPVEVTIVMTDRSVGVTTDTDATTTRGAAGDASTDEAAASSTADDGRDEPAHLLEYGPIPAGIARDLILDASRAWIRRLTTEPVTGRLCAIDPRRREFDGILRRAIVLRDQICRTPWCGAAIRHADHVIPAAEGGQTTFDNGQGLCEACNYTKTAPGWTNTPSSTGGAGDAVTITTPTGHTYRSRPPDLPGPPAKPALTEESGEQAHPPGLTHHAA